MLTRSCCISLRKALSGLGFRVDLNTGIPRHVTEVPLRATAFDDLGLSDGPEMFI